jgi:hypothetical protein
VAGIDPSQLINPGMADCSCLPGHLRTSPARPEPRQLKVRITGPDPAAKQSSVELPPPARSVSGDATAETCAGGGRFVITLPAA